MALAPYFDRAAIAASQVLKGFDLAAFRAHLEAQQPSIVLDRGAIRSAEGRIALQLTTNLFARLYPRIAIVPTSRTALRAAQSLTLIAKRVNPDIDVMSEHKPGAPLVAVTDANVPLDGLRLYVGSSGWKAMLDTKSPVGFGNTANPFGAAAAACFAAANTFRHVFQSQLPDGPPDASISLSLLDYSPGNGAAHEIPRLDLGQVQVVGLGAIGNGLVWILSKLPNMSGELHLIDHELVDLSNIQRYVLTDPNHVGEAKAEVSKEALAETAFRVRGFRATWAHYLSQRNDFDVRNVVVALDSAVDRIAVQTALPHRILNAWTQTDDLGVSRHHFTNNQACLACLYMPSGLTASEDEIVARALGLPQQVREIRRLLSQNAPVGRDLLSVVGTALGVPIDALMPFEGKPIRSFYAEAFCGGAVFRLSAGVKPAESLVPMAFQSVLAGVMLGAELVTSAMGMRPPGYPAITTVNLLRPLGSYLSHMRGKEPNGRCFCQDADYISAFRAKWD